MNLEHSTGYQKLFAAARRISEVSVADLFVRDPQRFRRFSAEFDELFYDFSRNQLDAPVLEDLLSLAEQRRVSEKIESLFAGSALNFTEQQPALHVLYRADTSAEYGNELLASEIARNQHDVLQIAERIRQNRALKTIINVGIGGSDLGAHLSLSALEPLLDQELDYHFFSDISVAEIEQLCKTFDPRSTLVIVASKSFLTVETIANATYLKQWLENELGNEAAQNQVFGVSAHPERMSEFGIPREQQAVIHPAVTGRYSVWSAMGLILRIAIGNERYEHFLEGAVAADQHFRTTPLASNLPVLMALVSIWNSNFLGIQTCATLVFNRRLQLLPDYLQQLEMESNGKTYRRDGSYAPYPTSSTIYGRIGLNAQHAFVQQLHQGSEKAYVELVACPDKSLALEDDLSLLSCLALSRALMTGTADDSGLAEHPYRYCEGNRPSSTLMLDELTPQVLGKLMATYEHKVFVQACIWGINPFDQWGVELSKVTNRSIVEALGSSERDSNLDEATLGLIRHLER